MNPTRPVIFAVAISLTAASAAAPVWAEADECRFKTPIADSLPLSQQADASQWSLPMEGLLGTTCGAQQNPKQPRRYDASIDVSDSDNLIGSQIDALVDAAWNANDADKALDKAVEHYRTRTQRVVAQTKDTLDYVVPFRGFGPSSEAGDVILGEQIKIKSRSSAEFARQKNVDELQLKVVASVMQICMGLGMDDKEKGNAASQAGVEQLAGYVGHDEAERTYSMLKTWTHQLQVPQAVFNQPVWDVASKQSKLESVLENALSADPVMQEIIKHVHKYNQHSKLARGTSKVIQTTLGVAALTPDFVGPAAKTALVAYVTATGGPEQSKLLKELYLDKRFESRWKVVNEQAHMALENYQVALLTRNPALLAASEGVVEQIAGRASVAKVFGQSVVGDTSLASVTNGM